VKIDKFLKYVSCILKVILNKKELHLLRITFKYIINQFSSVIEI